MPVQMTNPRPGATKEQLATAEAAVGARLPDPVRRSYLQHNGCHGMEDNEVDTPEGHDIGISVQYFLPVGTGGSESVEGNYDDVRGRLADGLVPVAVAAGGNLILVSVRRQDYGAVYFWDHEVEGATDDLQAPLVHLADDFDRFLEVIVTPDRE